MYPHRLDTDLKETFDAELLLPVFFPFLPGVLPDENDLGDVGHRFVGPCSSYFLEWPV